MYIHHFAIWTHDIEKVKDFYLKYFSCTPNKKYENTEKQFESYFITFTGGMRIELMWNPGISEKKDSDTIGLAHFAIIVGTKENVDRLTEQLERDGYTINSYPRTKGDGYYESVVSDPENNRIELVATRDSFEANTF
jgi:lactoylglutathione lyase